MTLISAYTELFIPGESPGGGCSGGMSEFRDIQYTSAYNA